jgi:hypothetical protein
MVEIGALLSLAVAGVGWAIEAHRRTDQRLDLAEGRISNLLIEVQRNRAHVLALSRRLAERGDQPRVK